MKKLVSILFLSILFSCSQQDLKKENEELLALTSELSLQVEKLRETAQRAASEAREAQAEAARQVELAREQSMRAQEEAVRAMRAKTELEEKLKNCK